MHQDALSRCTFKLLTVKIVIESNSEAAEDSHLWHLYESLPTAYDHCWGLKRTLTWEIKASPSGSALRSQQQSGPIRHSLTPWTHGLHVLPGGCVEKERNSSLPVCILLMSVTYSTDTAVNAVVKTLAWCRYACLQVVVYFCWRRNRQDSESLDNAPLQPHTAQAGTVFSLLWTGPSYPDLASDSAASQEGMVQWSKQSCIVGKEAETLS